MRLIIAQTIQMFYLTFSDPMSENLHQKCFHQVALRQQTVVTSSFSANFFSNQVHTPSWVATACERLSEVFLLYFFILILHDNTLTSIY